MFFSSPSRNVSSPSSIQANKLSISNAVDSHVMESISLLHLLLYPFSLVTSWKTSLGGLGRRTPVSLAPANQWSKQDKPIVMLFAPFTSSSRTASKRIQEPRDFETRTPTYWPRNFGFPHIFLPADIYSGAYVRAK